MEKLWIVYAKYHLKTAVYSPKLMSEAATKEGIENEVFYSEFFSVALRDGEEVLYYLDKQITDLPLVAFIRCYNFTLMKFLESKGVKVINTYDGMKKVKDKFETHKVVLKLNIKQPKSLLSFCSDFNLLKDELGLPFVMKDNYGAAGKRVYLINSVEEYNNIIENEEKTSFLFQQYISPSKGEDVRLYIVGDRVVGAVKRKATNDDFRSNISLGGSAVLFKPSQELIAQSLKIAKSLNIEIGSVDYLIDGEEFLFCEANGNAAFSAFYNLGYNMQKLFMEYIKERYFKN